jgi:hypothetical protein
METWGDKPKSQVDNSLIDDAIAAAIADHESDPDSHLEVGESLQSHKASEIIDHVAGSIVADKSSAFQRNFQTVFESIDGWEKSGEYELEGLNRLMLIIFGDVSPLSYVMATNVFFESINFKSFDVVFEEDMKWDDRGGNEELAFGILCGGYAPASVEQVGLYFYYLDDVLYARVKGTVTNSVEISGFSLSVSHKFRIHCDYSAGDVKFYIDGALAATVAWPAGAFTDQLGLFHAMGINDAEGDENLNVALFSSLSFFYY